MTTVETINYQNLQINESIKKMKEEKFLHERKYDYHTRVYASMHKINKMLKYTYYLLILIYHLFLIYKYTQKTRNTSFLPRDILVLVIFIAIPYLLPFIEEALYNGFMYLFSQLKNAVSLHNFYSFFGKTDFYTEPPLIK
jgi:hypothetical protein